MKKYAYILIVLLMGFASYIQSMDQVTLKVPTSKEELLEEKFFVEECDDASAFIVTDTSESSFDDEEQGGALLQRKRLQSAFPINKFDRRAEMRLPYEQKRENQSVALRQIVPSLALHEISGAAPTVYSTPTDTLLQNAEEGKVESAKAKNFGHHRSLPLTGSEGCDSSGFPISISRRQIQPLLTVPELEEGDSLSEFVAEVSFSSSTKEMGCK